MNSTTRPRIVIAGFGDTGMLTAIHLGQGFDIVAISSKPCMVSGQELGMRLAQTELWKRFYLTPFNRYPKLDAVRIRQGLATEVDTQARQLHYVDPEAVTHTLDYDVLVIATGTRNGFWRNNQLQSIEEIERSLDAHRALLAAAPRVNVIGAGPTGVSAAYNLKQHYPDTAVHLYFSQAEPLAGYHDSARADVSRRLVEVGVSLHHGHRADLAQQPDLDSLAPATVHWSSGQAPLDEALTLWAVGNTQPNSAFLPPSMLDEAGFVQCDPYLRVPGADNVFVIGDIAATDAMRSSARNWGFRVLANNIRAQHAGKPDKLQAFEPPTHRWGSILGIQGDGMRVYQPNGQSFRFSRWVVEKLLFPLAVWRAIYRGVRKTP